MTSPSPFSTPLGQQRLRRAVWVVFALLTLADVLSWRALWRVFRPQGNNITRAAFELADGGNVVARELAWSFPMLPQPYFADARTLVLMPGYPVLLTLPKAGVLTLDVYEQRAPPVMQLVGAAGTSYATLLATQGDTRLEPVGHTPTPRAAFEGLLDCFPASESIRFRFEGQGQPLKVTGGRCVWLIPVVEGSRLLVDSFASAARMELDAEELTAVKEQRYWLLILVLLASLIHRAAWARPAWVGMDAATALTCLLASALTPMWVVLWCLKGVVGLLMLAWLTLRWSLGSRTRRWGLGSVLLAGALVAVLGDPRWAAEVNTRFNESVSGLGGDGLKVQGRSADMPPDDTRQLLLGYSMINGAALARGAYGEGAMDRVMQRTCGARLGRFARHAIDGANGCFMAKRWNEVTQALPNLTRRIYFGGFNDDLTAPVSKFALWISLMVGVLPATDRAPTPMTLWEHSAQANLEPTRLEELMSCVESLARDGGPSRFMHVYDVATFDLGRPRAFGRTALEAARAEAVKRHGGRFVDARSLLPGESPLFFNDVVHLSEVGYAVFASELCALLERDH